MQNNQHAKKDKIVYLQLLGSVRDFLSNTLQLILIFHSVYKKNV